MATFGSTPSFNYYYFFDTGSSIDNQYATYFLTMPDNGWVTDVNVYVQGDTGASAVVGVVWDGNGNTIDTGTAVNIAQGSRSVSGQAWYTSHFSPGVFIAKGTTIRIGWTKATSGTVVFSTNGTTGGNSAVGGNPGALGSPLNGLGTPGAYITYTPVSAASATTNAATAVAATAATLNGTVGDGGVGATGGGNSSYYFQYSTDPNLGTYTQTSTQSFSGTGQAVSASLSGLASNVTYYFRVVAVNLVGTTYGSILSFSTNGLPNAPTLTSPANNAAVAAQSSSTTFAWTYNAGTGSGETNYALKLTTGGTNYWWNGTSLVTTETYVTEATTKTIPAGILTPSVTYLWTVSSQDNIGKGPYASAFTLISEGPPAAPTLTSPINGIYIDVATPPTLQWTYNPTNGQGGQTNFAIRRKISGASSYSYFNVGTNSWQSTIVWNSGSAGSYTFGSGLWSDGNTYNWSIATQDAGGQGPFAPDATFTAQAVPVVNVTSPSGSTAQSKPVVVWANTLPSGAVETNYQVRTFSAAQYGAGGFNPATSASTDDSSVLSGALTSYQIQTALPAGTSYRSYVNVTETGGETNGFNAFGAFTVTLDLPPTPVLTAKATTDPATGCPMIQLTAQTAINLLSSDDASFESSIGTFVGSNCTLAQSSTQALDGSFSLRLTASSAATMFANSGYYAVQPSTPYSFEAFFRAGSTARNVQVFINWYDSSHAFIFNVSSIAVADTTTGWTQATITAISPSNAAYAVVSPNITSPANTEIHYVDECGLFPVVVGANGLSDPGFESAAVGTLPTSPGSGDWVVNSVGTGVASIETANPHSGVNNLKLTNPSSVNYGGTFNQRGILVAGVGAFYITFWAKGSAGGTSGPLRITFANAGTSVNSSGIATAQPSAQAGTASVDLNPALTTSYQQFSEVVNVPGGYTWAFIEIYANSNGTPSSVFIDDIQVLPGAAAGSQIWTAGGFLATAGIVILRSDGLYVRNASAANPASVPSSQAAVVVNDYEVTPLTAYTYQALVQATGAQGLVQSVYSTPPQGASVSTTKWWELDPTVPSTAIAAQPIQFNPSITEQSAAHQVLGQQTMHIIASAVMGTDMTATMEVFDAATFNGLMALATSQKTIFFSDPFGNSYYFRIAPGPGGMSSGMGNKIHDSQLLASTAAAPHRTVSLTGVAQPRPQV